LYSGSEAKANIVLNVEVAAIGERLPSAMSGNGRFRHTCQQQGGGATTTKGMTRVVGWILMENCCYPATDTADESCVGERCVGVSVLDEEGLVGLAEGARQELSVCTISSERAEDVVVAAGERHCCRDERCFAEWNGEVDTPHLWGDVADEEAGTCVFLDTEQTEEGEEAGTPVACICEDAEVEGGVDGV